MVGPYVALEKVGGGLVPGRPLEPVQEQQSAIVALLTFVAGLGAGAIVALQSKAHARAEGERRRAAIADARRRARR
jgi:hypothetical protein